MPDDRDILRYTFLSKGSTQGAVTGKHRSWKGRGSIIMAPRGEFDHLSDRMYTARVIDTKKDASVQTSTDAAEDAVKDAGGDAVYTTGEPKPGGWIPILKDGEEVATAHGPNKVSAKIDELKAND